MVNVGDIIEVAGIEYVATKEGHNWGTCDNCAFVLYATIQMLIVGLLTALMLFIEG